MQHKLDYLRVLVLVENTAPFGLPLQGQHGLSYYIEGRSGQAALRIIMDVGQSHSVLDHNMKLLNISAESIDAVVLSHCHYDHTGGVAALLAKTGKTGLPVIAHTDIYRPHFRATPISGHMGMGAEDSAQAIACAGGKLFLTTAPFLLMPGLTTTGEIPRLTPFEEGMRGVYTIKDGRVVEDDIPDDNSLVACVQGRGLVVVAGCSHAGIINIIKQALVLFPGEKLYAVIGGMHLVGASAERLALTVQELVGYEPALVAAGHCTGFTAQAAFHHALGDRFVPLNVGAEFVMD